MKLDRRIVRVLMSQHNLSSVADMARATGLHRNQISSLLNGSSEPSMETLGILCRVLRCTPNDILTVAMPERELA